MKRIQIYFPKDIHNTLLRLSKEERTTLSHLVTEGANIVIKKYTEKLTVQEETLRE